MLTGNGKLFESFGTKSSSLAIEPRATVFSRTGRSDRPSAKNSEGESGLFFGWVAISCRIWSQPPVKRSQSARQVPRAKRKVLVIGYLAHMMRMQAVE